MIYLLRRVERGQPFVPEATAMVVTANNQQEARQIAARYSGKQYWLDKTLSTIARISGTNRVILASYE